MDVLTDLQVLKDEHTEVMRKLSMLRDQNSVILRQLIDATDPTLPSKDREQLKKLLDAPDGNMRSAALVFLDMRNWTSNLAKKCASLALNDPDAQVRGVAVLILPKLHAEIGKPRIVTLLAQIVLDSHEQTMIRQAAFRSLLKTMDVPYLSKQWKDSWRDDFPNIADLDYAKSCVLPPEP
jgi:hypothetical protein